MSNKPLTKLIIIDDDPDILLIAKYSLEEVKGISIKYCDSGQQGIQEALVFQPDLILVDVMMPNMDGIAFVQALRLIPSLAKISVAFLTAKIQKEDLEKYNAIGIKELITKPFDPITFPETIQNLWEKISIPQ